MAEQKKPEMMPNLQTIKEYIENHYMDELVESLTYCIKAGEVEGWDIPLEGSRLVVDKLSCSLKDVQCYYLDRTKLIANIKMRMKVGISTDQCIPRYSIRLISFSVEMTLDHGITLSERILDPSLTGYLERGLQKLSEYLVPVANNSELDSMVQKIIKTFLGDDGQKRLIKDNHVCTELVEAMGLHIEHGTLYKKRHVKAMLFLKASTVQIVSPKDESDFKEVCFPENTIFINDDKSNLSNDFQLICHECAHYYLHSMFYELQNLHASDLALLGYAEADKTAQSAENALHFVEYQANYCALATLMPYREMMSMMNRFWKNVMDSTDNMGQKYADIIFRMHSETQIAKSTLRTRLCWMGFSEAKGAYNFIDDKYVAPFGFDVSKLKYGDRFVISRKEFTTLCEKDDKLREFVNNHHMIYVDGHVCLNSPKCVIADRGTPELTPWALENVDRCCLKFKFFYRLKAETRQSIGQFESSEEYTEAYFAIHTIEATGIEMEMMNLQNLAYLEELPRRPSKLLSKLIKDRVKTQAALVRSSHLSAATISRMCSDDSYKYDLQAVTRLVVGLRLPPILSGYLLELVGFSSSMMLRNLQYKLIIDCMFMDEIQVLEKTHGELFR